MSNLLGFEDGEHYPEKNRDYRVRRERVPVSRRFIINENIYIYFLFSFKG